MSPKLALAISLALAAPCVGAASYEPFADTVVELRINDQPQPVTLVVRRDTDGTLLLSAADLKELRIKAPARGVVQVNGQRYYRIGAELGAQVRFDDATQSVSLLLPAQAFTGTRAGYSAADAPRVTPAARAASSTTTCSSATPADSPRLAQSSKAGCSAHMACW